MDAWKVPAFRRWLGANTVNEVGSIASQSVLPVLIYERTHEPIAVAALGVVAVAPYLLIGLHAGGLADRFDRRRILVGALTAQGMVAAGLAIGLGTLGAQPLLVIGCELLSAMIFVFADAASFGLLPHLVPASTLGGAWGLVNATTSTAAILVPPVAIGLTATVGGPPVVAADAVSYLAAAFLLARASPIMRRRPNADPSSGGIGEGLRFVVRHPALRPLVAAGFLNSMAFGGVAGLLVVYAIRNLGIPAHGAGIGALLAVISIGGLVTSLMFGRIFAPDRIRVLTVAATATSAAMTAALAITRSVPEAAAILLVYAIALPVTTMGGIVYRQTVAPEHLRSRVIDRRSHDRLGRSAVRGGARRRRRPTERGDHRLPALFCDLRRCLSDRHPNPTCTRLNRTRQRVRAPLTQWFPGVSPKPKWPRTLRTQRQSTGPRVSRPQGRPARRVVQRRPE
jgi:MFS family permease